MKTSHKLLIATAVAIAVLASVSRDTPQEKEQKYLKRGNELFAQGQFDKARIEYRNAAKLVPIDPEISYRWGLTDEAQGNIRNAYANFVRAEQQDPHYAPALLKIAHYQLVVEQYKEVQKRIDTVLSDHPENPEAHALLASLHLRRKEMDNARKEIDAAFAQDPANITAFSVLTGLYVAEGNMEKAEATVDAGIAKNPTDLSLLLLKVRLFEKPLNMEKINKAYQEIIKLQPGDVQLRTVLADIYSQGGKTEEAETTLRNAVHDLPDNWELKRRLVAFLSTNKGMDAAEKEIQSYMQAFPDKADLYFWLADLYISFNQVDKAVALLEQIVAKDTSDRQSLFARSSLARINFRKGDKEQAQKLVNAVLAKAPTNAEALYVRASIATDEGKLQEAVTDLRLIIRDNPKNKDALQLLAEVLLSQGYIDLAIETLNQVVEVDPANSSAQVRLAQMYNEHKEPEHAMKILNLVAKTDPGYPVAWESIARIAIDMKDNDTANLALEKLKTFKGQETLVAFLTGQMAQSRGATSEARATYTHIIDADPTSALAERAVFEMVKKFNKPEEIAQTAAYLATLKSDSPYINTILGECYLAMDKKDLAADAFDKAIANHPASPDAHLHRAQLYIDAGNPGPAIDLLTAAHGISASDARPDMVLGDLYRHQGKYAEAIALYDGIVQRFPDTDIAANNMAALVADYFFTDAALLAKAEKAMAHFSSLKNPAYQDTLAWVYYRGNKITQAQTLMEQSMAQTKDVSAETHYHYGAILLKSGNKVKAKAELEQATAPGAPAEIAEKASELLKEI